MGQNKDYTENCKSTMADVILLQDLEDGETNEIKPIVTEKDDGTIEIEMCNKKGITDIQELIELVKKHYNIIKVVIF